MPGFFYDYQQDYIDKLNMLYDAFAAGPFDAVPSVVYEAPTGTVTQGHALNGIGTGTTYSALESVTHGRASAASLPTFFGKLRAYNGATRPTLNVVAFGSSVWKAEVLPDPATQSPGAVFTSMLKAALDPGDMYEIVFHNFAVNGSTVSEHGTAWASMVAAGVSCDIGLLGYGMNDGAVAQFNGGQSFNGSDNSGFVAEMGRAIDRIQKSGGDAVVFTTPHPSVVAHAASLYVMPPGIPQQYPVFKAAPVAPEALDPPASESNITGDFLQNGVAITVGYRYKRVNEGARASAMEHGCPLVDAERYWFEAIQKYQESTGSAAGAEGVLYGPVEIVHPKLLGHQLSYGRATADFIQAIAGQGVQPSSRAQIQGRLGINLPASSPVPAAYLDVRGRYADLTTAPVSIKAQIGTLDANGIPAQVEVLRIDPANGRVTTSAIVLGAKESDKKIVFKNYAEELGYIDNIAVYNIANGATFNLPLPSNSGYRVTIRGLHPGIQLSQVYDNLFSSRTLGATATLTQGVPREIGAGTEFSVAVSGLNLAITSNFDGLSIYIRVDAF